MVDNGFYVIDDSFFRDFPDPNLMWNKYEHRPHYFAVKDHRTGLYWMIPLSSRVEKYRSIIERREHRGKPCTMLHICKLDNGEESVFLLQNMFPVTEKYIKRPYTIASTPLILTSEAQAKAICSKVKRVISLIRHGTRFSYMPDTLSIEKKLLEDK